MGAELLLLNCVLVQVCRMPLSDVGGLQPQVWGSRRVLRGRLQLDRLAGHDSVSAGTTHTMKGRRILGLQLLLAVLIPVVVKVQISVCVCVNVNVILIYITHLNSQWPKKERGTSKTT